MLTTPPPTCTHDAGQIDTYTFKKEEGIWYIYLPDYLKQGWQKEDLRMVDGAYKFLNALSRGATKLRLRIGTQPQPGAGLLELLNTCNAPKGGGIYLYTPAEPEAEGALFWICDLALFIFGDIPESISVKQLSVKGKSNAAVHPTDAVQPVRVDRPAQHAA